MNILKNLSIQKKLVFLIIVIFSGTILSAGIYAAISFMNSSKKVSADIAEVINDSYTFKVKSELERGIAMLNALSNTIQIESVENTYKIKESNIDLLQTYLSSNKDITHLFLLLDNHFKYEDSESDFENDKSQTYELSFYNKENDVVSVKSETGRFAVDLLKLKNQEYEQTIYMSDPFTLNFIETDKTVVTFSKTLYHKNKVVGAIGINFSLSKISDIINSVLYYEEGTKSILLTEKKNVVFVSDKPWLSGKNIQNLNTQEQEIYNYLKLNKPKTSGIENYTGSYNSFGIENVNIRWEILTMIPYNVLIKELMSNIFISILIASLIIVLGLLIIIFFVKRSFLPINRIISASRKISKGEPVKLKQGINNSEFEKIIDNFNQISNNLKEAADISSGIAKGNYNVRIKQKSEEDILSISINKIAENLKSSEERTILQEKTTSKQLWMRRGRFEVSEAERISKNNIKDLTFNILKELVNYTGAILGGIYLYDSENETITLTASYAYENKKNISKVFKPGEGLVGACVIEKKKIILNKITDDYIKIVSGLGSGIPSNISIIPVFYQGRINAVIELAFLKQPDDYVIEFIEQLSDNVGAWIDASLINTKTADLLHISREQTKELAEKEQELNSKVEELQKFQVEIDIQNAENKSIMNAINHTVMTVEYTLDGIVLNSNAKYEEIMGFKLDDIKGSNVFDMVKDQKGDLSLIIEKVAAGQPVKRQVKRYAKSGKEKWLSATYTPYYNIEGEISRVLFFAHDITEMKSELDELKINSRK